MSKSLENTKVKANQSTVLATVIKSMTYLSIEISNNMQYRDIHKPIHWMFDNIDESIIDAIIKSLNQYDVLRETHNDFIQARLDDLIATEGDEKNGEYIYTDYTYTIIEKKCNVNECKVCPKRGSEVQNNLRARKLCKWKLIRPNVSDDDFIKIIAPINPYEHFRQILLTLIIRVGFLGVRFVVGVGVGKFTPCLKLIRSIRNLKFHT